MSDRETIFNAIHKALDPLPERTPYPEWESGLTVARHARGAVDRLDLFLQRLTAAKGIALQGWESLGAFLEKQDAQTGYVDSPLAEKARAALPGCTLEEAFLRKKIDSYAFGITRASGAIAETGTVILQDADSPHRLAALAPWIHIAVIRPETIFQTLAEAVEAFGNDPSIVYVTGPSKTADIEGILIQGVHGPGIQACLIE